MRQVYILWHGQKENSNYVMETLDVEHFRIFDHDSIDDAKQLLAFCFFFFIRKLFVNVVSI